ncbi:hypothetical protein [Paludisphaera mucosa]|uniref:Uncharacterized protein n=1 Tax=Paludisphaera mucosa TaxID=3030827 RepID=A0ABT6FBI4_9BACT|nr:hypothetical protein [Paludisphaera mucosa]MDG3004953.1 hypothetical protein [Paludisphaera mucosa]
MKKHQFVPDRLAPMEERALLSGFSFPAALGGANTLGLKGAFVLTSRTYATVQHDVDVAITSFIRNVTNVYNRQHGFTDAFYAKVGLGTYGMGAQSYQYQAGTGLANLDARMSALEIKLPYGRGLGATNPTGGVGLSNQTALTSLNPALTDPAEGALSVAELMENAIGNATTPAELQANMQAVRTQALAIGSHGVTGILPSYVAAFGPLGGVFGTRNT